MKYIEDVQELRTIRKASVERIVSVLEDLVTEVVRAERSIEERIAEFHRSQTTFRITRWFEVELRMPQENDSAMVFDGPFLYRCFKEQGRIRKERINGRLMVLECLGKGFLDLQARYARMGLRLTKFAKALDVGITPAVAAAPKGQKRDRFKTDREARCRLMGQTIRQLEGSLEKLDEEADELIFDFNEIEGKFKRYGSLLCRWDVPSRMPATSVSVPAGPEVFYISFNRTHRMTKPIGYLYEKVHGKKPRARVTLTHEMIQRSRLGKYYSRYRSAYAAIQEIRHKRSSIIEVLEKIQRLS